MSLKLQTNHIPILSDSIWHGIPSVIECQAAIKTEMKWDRCGLSRLTQGRLILQSITKADTPKYAQVRPYPDRIPRMLLILTIIYLLHGTIQAAPISNFLRDTSPESRYQSFEPVFMSPSTKITVEHPLDSQRFSHVPGCPSTQIFHRQETNGGKQYCDG